MYLHVLNMDGELNFITPVKNTGLGRPRKDTASVQKRKAAKISRLRRLQSVFLGHVAERLQRLSGSRSDAEFAAVLLDS